MPETIKGIFFFPSVTHFLLVTLSLVFLSLNFFPISTLLLHDILKHYLHAHGYKFQTFEYMKHLAKSIRGQKYDIKHNVWFQTRNDELQCRKSVIRDIEENNVKETSSRLKWRQGSRGSLSSCPRSTFSLSSSVLSLFRSISCKLISSS